MRRKCEANLTFVFHALAEHTDVDVSPAENTGTPARSPACRTGVDDGLPDRVSLHVGGDPRRGPGRGNTHRIDSERHRTGLPRSGHLHPSDGHAYRQQLTAQILEQEEERSALVEALLSRRITDTQSLWEAADLLRLPTTGPYVVVAAELPAIGKLALPAIENKLAARDIRSAWRLLPDLHIGIVHVRIREASTR